MPNYFKKMFKIYYRNHTLVAKKACVLFKYYYINKIVLLVYRHKSVFMIIKIINRDVYLKPPKGVECNVKEMWKLNTSIYGFYDAPRSWYLSVKKKLVKLGAIVRQSNPSVFVGHNKLKLNGLLCTHIDDFLWRRSNFP